MIGVGSTASFFGTKLSYAAGLGFMRNMQVVIGNKVSRLPLGWFKADSAGRLSRMVTQEMISTGQAAALFVGQLINNAAAASATAQPQNVKPHWGSPDWRAMVAGIMMARPMPHITPERA